MVEQLKPPYTVSFTLVQNSFFKTGFFRLMRFIYPVKANLCISEAKSWCIWSLIKP